MRRAITLLIVSALVGAGSASLAAQGKARGPKTTTTTATARAPKASSGQTTTTRTPKSTQTRGPKTTTARGPQSTAHAGNKPAKGATTTPTSTSSPNLPRNQRLVDRLRQRLDLPPGTDMAPYAAGFRNQGQFVAAVNVSENLGINFIELKALMVDKNLSLGQAIQQLKPGVDSEFEANRAVRQSRQQ